MITKRYLVFGFALSFFSSFGQTFFIGMFKEDILAQYSWLSHGSYGSWYAAMTMTSAFCLAYAGRRIDDMDLQKFALGVCGGLVFACVLMAYQTHFALLLVALFGLRFFGQGLMSHTSQATTARYFDHFRGRALSLVNLGHPAGEAVLPILAAVLISHYGSTAMWICAILALVVIVLPMIIILLKGHGERHDAHMSKVEENGHGSAKQWTARQVLFSSCFLTKLPLLLMPAFLTTGVMFHQDLVKAEMGWSRETFAAGMITYAVSQVIVAPIGGILVDRISAVRLLPFYILPYAAVMILFPWVGGIIGPHVLLAGAGISSGLSFAISGASLAELYGVKHTGAIRSQLTVAMVISTAISPALIGWIADKQVATTSIIVGGGVIALVSTALCLCGPSSRQNLEHTKGK